MFVKFGCGCVGIPLEDGARAMIVSLCDGDPDRPCDSLSWGCRDISESELRIPLTEQEEADLHARIARRFAAADRFDDVVSALGIPKS